LVTAVQFSKKNENSGIKKIQLSLSKRILIQKLYMLKISDIFILGSALLSMALSIYLWFNGYREEGLFVGIWVPSLLGFGNYIKLTAQEGSNG